MVSGIIQRQQRDNIITAINSADVVVIYSARSISKDVMSLISESDLLTRIMMVQGVTLERVPKIIFANANMPSYGFSPLTPLSPLLPLSPPSPLAPLSRSSLTLLSHSLAPPSLSALPLTPFLFFPFVFLHYIVTTLMHGEQMS